MTPTQCFSPARGSAVAFGFAVGMSLASAAAAQSTPADESAAGASGKPLWEAGLIAGVTRLPDYPGASQSHLRGLAAPLLVYRGPVLRIDPAGVRGRFVSTSDWDLELSATGAFNARDDAARVGMPALDYLFAFGPQIVYKGLHTGIGQTTLHLKARAAVSTDFHHLRGRGYTLDPELRWRLQPLAESSARLTLSLQPSWATRPLQRYFYEVEPGQATALRPAFDARAGYVGTRLSATLSGGNGQLLWFVGVQAMSLRGAANADSPLLRDRSTFGVGAGLMWTLWHSAARAAE